MPFVISYPSELKAGLRIDDIILNIDFAPLFLDYAGVTPPVAMQGRSFRRNLKGKHARRLAQGCLLPLL